MAYGVMKGGYGVRRGDYKVRKGDPGLLPAILGGVSLVKKAITAIKGVKKASTVPVLAGAAGLAAFGPPPQGQVKVPGLKGMVQRTLPGGETGYMTRKRRRMNPANPKALRRAIRRQEGFIKLARRTLKGTGYVIRRTGTKAMARKRS